jgi:hypothetical protein
VVGGGNGGWMNFVRVIEGVVPVHADDIDCHGYGGGGAELETHTGTFMTSVFYWLY